MLEWQSWLCGQLIRGYYTDQQFYAIGNLKTIDNPDQRISEDVPSFTRASVSLGNTVARKIMTLFAFAGAPLLLGHSLTFRQLQSADCRLQSVAAEPALPLARTLCWQIAAVLQHTCSTQGPGAGVLWGISPKLVLFLLGYTLLGTWLTTSAFGKRLMQLEYSLLARSGDLRFGLVRTRENAGEFLLSRPCLVVQPVELRFGSQPLAQRANQAAGCGQAAFHSVKTAVQQ